jgi:thiol-disulfide isomerase/thioredoxin
MPIRRIVFAAAILTAAGFVVAGMVAYTQRVNAELTHATVEDGATISLLRNRRAIEPFTARTLDGREVSLAALRGKVVIVNFWATWCPPCREEIPDLIALQEKYKDQLQIIGVSQDEGAPEMVARFVAEHRMNYPVVMTSAEIERQFPNINALPTSFMIDRDGRIAQRHVGLLNASLTETETRVLAGLATNVKVEFAEDQDRQRLENAAQANKIPGIDLSKLTPEQRGRVLQTLNSELCSCGCGQTVAQCRLEDPTCTVSLPLAEDIVRKIVAESGK